ncbi:hypothetical protein CDL60_18015 [Roseateles noduli]|nr:hypothetical protein CDL60_18015 [Roseateles noduli]
MKSDGFHNYGTRLRQAVHLRKIPKLFALSQRLGVTDSALSRWMKSEPIAMENFAKLCVELDVNADWLLLGRGGPEAPDLPHQLDRRLHQALTRMAPRDVQNLAVFLDELKISERS